MNMRPFLQRLALAVLCTGFSSPSLFAQIQVSLQRTNILCGGFPTGQVTSTVSNNNGNIAYSWSNGSTTPNLTNVPAGVYGLTVTDAVGSSSASVTLTQPPPLVNNLVTSCSVPGTITANASGGVTPYMFMWSNGVVGTNVVSNLAAGNYCVTVMDANNCGIVSCTNVGNGPTVTIQTNPLLCPNSNNGSATATPSGGITPYSYAWNTGATTASIGNLAPGSYSVTITDNRGCTASASANIAQPSSINISLTPQQPTCFGTTNGSIQAMVSGGQGPYAYNWSNGGGTSSISGLAQGTYTVTVSDMRGCTATQSATITYPTSIHVTANVNNITCFGTNNGSITTTVIGGTTPYSYLWSNGSILSNINSLSAGTYMVTVSDVRGCTATTSATVTAPTAVNLVVTSSNVTSCGGNNGTATAVVSGGTAPYAYAWSNGQNTSTANGLSAGMYTITVSDANNCTKTANVIIMQPTALMVSIGGNTTVCPNTSSGMLTTNVSGGMAPFAYIWNNGLTTPTISGLAAGTYTVTVTSANSCTGTASATINSLPAVTLQITTTPDACGPNGTGTATVNVSSGAAPFTYQWSNGGSTATISNLTAGNYMVTVTSSNGCSRTGIAVVQEVNDFILDTNVQNPRCNGQNSGSIAVSGWGGLAPYTYLWNTGATSGDLFNLLTGTYSVTVTDANGCVLSQTFTLTAPPAIVATINSSNIACNTNNTGSASVSASGGTPGFTYAWSNGASGTTIQNLGTGTYTVTISDANNCTVTRQAIINRDPAPTVTLSITQIACNSANNGAIQATATNGNAPFTYVWSNGQTGATITGLSASTYIVTATSANGCTATAQGTITQPTTLTIDVVSHNIKCNGGSDGYIEVSGWGGTPGYTYAWSNGATTPILQNLGVGTYTVTITDAAGCTVVRAISITQPTAIALSLSPNTITCGQTNTGAITSSITGGTPGYTYNWSNGATSANISNLPAGSYSVTTTDANGCTKVASATINSQSTPVVTISKTNVTCFGASNGTAIATATNGVSPYTYLWSNGQTNATATGLASGNYTVTVTDANGCTATGTIGIGQPSSIQVQFSTVPPACNGGNTGQATAIASGGTAPYSYAWSNGQSTGTATNLGAGTYTVTVSDGNSCTRTATVTLINGANITVVATGQATCQNSTNGSATATGMGGVAPYTYTWNNGQTTPSINGLSAGTYNVTVSDANNCTGTASANVAASPLPNCTITVTQNISTPNGANGAASVTAIGGNAPFSFQWSNGQSGATANNLAPGIYIVTVTNAQGCTSTCAATLINPAKVGDFVWNDFDNDGIQDGGEPGIFNVSATLTGTTATGANYTASTTTDANGMYMFLVPPGTYKVTFITPQGYANSPANAGLNDAIDSDVNPSTGMTPFVTVGSGETNPTLDAGFHTVCQNVTDPGTICCNQSLCGPGNTPAPLTSLTPATGGTGQLEYLWMFSTNTSTFNSTWSPIPNSNTPNYTPGVIYQTTYYARCARRVGCPTFFETNIITVIVRNDAVATISGPDYLCVNDIGTFTAANSGSSATYNWNFTGPATPSNVAGQTATTQWTSFGYFRANLTVNANGCTARNYKDVSITNSPIFCGSPLIIQGTVHQQSKVIIQWNQSSIETDLVYVIERSADGSRFDSIGILIHNPAHSNYFYEDTEVKRGRSLYRVRLQNSQSDVRYSNEIETSISQGIDVAHIYPNPVSDRLFVELINPAFGPTKIGIFTTSGQLLVTDQIEEQVFRKEINTSQLPKGVYIVMIEYSGGLTKALRLVKS